MEQLEGLQEQIVYEDLLRSRIMYGNELECKSPAGGRGGGSVEVIEGGKKGIGREWTRAD